MEMLVEMLGMLVADVARQGRTEQAAGATGNHGRRKYAEQRAARSHPKTAEHGGQIDARADDGAFGVAASGMGDLRSHSCGLNRLVGRPLRPQVPALGGTPLVV